MPRYSVVAISLAILIPQFSCAQVTIDGEKFEDPTQPLTLPRLEAAARADAPRKPVRGVFAVGFVRVSQGSSIAVVNGEQAEIGSQIDGAEVVAIDASGVTLRVGDETRVVAPISSIVSSTGSSAVSSAVSSKVSQ